MKLYVKLELLSKAAEYSKNEWPMTCRGALNPLPVLVNVKNHHSMPLDEIHRDF